MAAAVSAPLKGGVFMEYIVFSNDNGVPYNTFHKQEITALQ